MKDGRNRFGLSSVFLLMTCLALLFGVSRHSAVVGRAYWNPLSLMMLAIGLIFFWHAFAVWGREPHRGEWKVSIVAGVAVIALGFWMSYLVAMSTSNFTL